MMLEYTLYKAIEAHLLLLREVSTDIDLVNKRLDDAAVFHASPASTLTETYNTLVLLFKHNHPGETFKSSTLIDTRILQFLILLRMWLLRQTSKQDDTRPHVSSDMRVNLLKDRIINQTYRNLWLQYRAHPMSPSTSLSTHTWYILTTAEFVNLADHVIPRFMEISEEFASAFQGLSEKWMHLAAHLLTQSAIEIIASIFENQASEIHAEINTSNAQQALETCFAWDHVERYRFTESLDDVVLAQLQSALTTCGRNVTTELKHDLIQTATHKAEFEDRVWEMFFDQGSKSTSSPTVSNKDITGDGIGKTMSNGTPHSSGELSSWTKIRQNALEDVLFTYTSMLEADTEHRERPLQILKEQHSLNRLIAELTTFVSRYWSILHGSEWYEKPALVQIEEGGLNGMTSEEFEMFAGRAGIAGMP